MDAVRSERLVCKDLFQEVDQETYFTLVFEKIKIFENREEFYIKINWNLKYISIEQRSFFRKENEQFHVDLT